MRFLKDFFRPGIKGIKSLRISSRDHGNYYYFHKAGRNFHDFTSHLSKISHHIKNFNWHNLSQWCKILENSLIMDSQSF